MDGWKFIVIFYGFITKYYLAFMLEYSAHLTTCALSFFFSVYIDYSNNEKFGFKKILKGPQFVFSQINLEKLSMSQSLGSGVR